MQRSNLPAGQRSFPSFACYTLASTSSLPALPQEVWSRILDFLPLFDIVHLRPTSRSFCLTIEKRLARTRASVRSFRVTKSLILPPSCVMTAPDPFKGEYVFAVELDTENNTYQLAVYDMMHPSPRKVSVFLPSRLSDHRPTSIIPSPTGLHLSVYYPQDVLLYSYSPEKSSLSLWRDLSIETPLPPHDQHTIGSFTSCGRKLLIVHASTVEGRKESNIQHLLLTCSEQNDVRFEKLTLQTDDYGEEHVLSTLAVHADTRALCAPPDTFGEFGWAVSGLGQKKVQVKDILFGGERESAAGFTAQGTIGFWSGDRKGGILGMKGHVKVRLSRRRTIRPCGTADGIMAVGKGVWSILCADKTCRQGLITGLGKHTIVGIMAEGALAIARIGTEWIAWDLLDERGILWRSASGRKKMAWMFGPHGCGTLDFESYPVAIAASRGRDDSWEIQRFECIRESVKGKNTFGK